MKRDYRLIPIWFWPIVVLATFLLLNMCGCRTGGKWVGSGSTGAKQIIIPSELQRQPDGTYRIKPKESKSIEIKSTPVKAKSAVTKPELPKLESAVAEDLPPANVKAAGLVSPFKPTITTPKLEERVNVRPIKNPPANIVEGGCVVITDGKGKSEIAGPCEVAPKEEATVTVKWMELFAFYFLAIMLAVFFWILYDIYKQYKKSKVNNKPKKTPTKKKKAPLKRKRGRPKKKSS